MLPLLPIFQHCQSIFIPPFIITMMDWVFWSRRALLCACRHAFACDCAQAGQQFVAQPLIKMGAPPNLAARPVTETNVNQRYYSRSRWSPATFRVSQKNSPHFYIHFKRGWNKLRVEPANSGLKIGARLAFHKWDLIFLSIKNSAKYATHPPTVTELGNKKCKQNNGVVKQKRLLPFLKPLCFK